MIKTGPALVSYVVLISFLLTQGSDLSYAQLYAARRSDYFLRRAASAPSGSIACGRLVEAAIDASPGNDTVVSLGEALKCPGALAPMGNASFQVPSVQSWTAAPGKHCPEYGDRVDELFSTPVGFAHASHLGLQDWRGTLKHFRDASVKRFREFVRKKMRAGKEEPFANANNAFFQNQILNPTEAMKDKQQWPEMYASEEYLEFSQKARQVCVSYMRELGLPLSKLEAERMDLVMWAAVYPGGKADVTHYYHAHQESLVSFVMYVATPDPGTPMTIADPRGAPPIEDFEYFQPLGDLGIDGEPPFHRTLEFHPGEGDVIVFPSYAIHKVPPHVAIGTRVAWACNCHLPQLSKEHPFDGWERIVHWPPGRLGGRPKAVPAYHAHAQATLAHARELQDPYMKLWEAQNQVVAMLQFAPSDAKVWLKAANVSAHVALVLMEFEGSDYFPDSVAMVARALLLNSSLVSQLKGFLSPFKHRSSKRNSEVSRAVARFTSEIESWKGSPPDLECHQFLHPLINGPGRCGEMCPWSAPAPLQGVVVVPAFGTRVVTARIGTAVEETLVQIASQILAAPSMVKYVTPEVGWWRTENASLAGVVCSTPSQVWIADPRGSWPERWPGAIHLLRGGVEPKAPFHWHAELPCTPGEALLFPAWLFHQVLGSARRFVVNAAESKRGTSWRVPEVSVVCARSELHRSEL